MTDRHTVDTINSDALDALYDQVARVRALADRWDNALAPDKPYARTLRAALAGPADTDTTVCAPIPAATLMHLSKVPGELRQTEPAPDVTALYEKLTAMFSGPLPWPPPEQPHTGLVVQPYRNDQGQHAWVFRCWGTNDGCDGWLSLDHSSQQSAERARDRHVAEEHASKEQP